MVITSFAQLQVLQEIPFNTSFVDEQGEWWRNVTYPSYEKRYLVGNLGHIYGISRHKVLEVSLHPQKYQGLVLYDGTGHSMFREIYVIVARRFRTDSLPEGYPLGGMTAHWGVVSIILTKTPQIIGQIIQSLFRWEIMTDTGIEVSIAHFTARKRAFR